MGKILKQHYLACNVDETASKRREKFDGVEHLVVPVVAAQEMVMNGLLYPAEEFRGWEDTWNGIPVPVNHPVYNGVNISAKSPRVHEKNSVGWFYNVEFTEDKKLKGEIWLNLDKAETLGHTEIVNKFESGEIMEVSTGLYSSVEIKSGEFNGKEYQGIVRHIRPDHLALLPNETGACSVEDGCGTMRDNKEACQCKEPKTIKDKLIKAFKMVGEQVGFTSNELSYRDIMARIETLLHEEQPQGLSYVYVIDLFDNYFVYEEGRDGAETLYKRSYGMIDGGIQLGSDTLEVVRKTTYEAAESSSIDINVRERKLEEIIKSVIANKANSFVEADRSILEGIYKDIISKMVSNEEAEPEAAEPEAVEPEAVEPAAEASELLDNMKDSPLKEFLSNAVCEHKAQKDAIVSNIVKNSEFSKVEAEALSYEMLTKLNNSLKTPDYSGRGASLSANTTVYKVASVSQLGRNKGE